MKIPELKKRQNVPTGSKKTNLGQWHDDEEPCILQPVWGSNDDRDHNVADDVDDDDDVEDDLNDDRDHDGEDGLDDQDGQDDGDVIHRV